MTLRQKLETSINPIEIIWGINPWTCTEKDVETLLRIRKCKNSDRLAFLKLEASWWIQDNLAVLKRRFIKEAKECQTQESKH